jgi:hypothetical protein
MAVGLTAIAVILVVLLSQKAQRRSGTDLTPNGAFVATLAPGQETCQGAELLPADTSAARATIGTYGKPGPRLRLTVTSPDGQLISSGTLAPGWRQGVVQIPLTHVSKPSENNRVCLHDLGASSVAIAGALPDPSYVMEVAGKSVDGRLRYDYMRPGRESWFQLLPTIVYRWTLAKAGLVRHWGWVAIALLMLFAVGLAARTIVREEPR